MGYIGNQSAGITYTNINTFRGKVANLTALNAVSGMDNGDLYLTEDNNHAHMYTGTAWVDLGAITGPQGPVGPRGIAGASVSTVVRTTGDGSAGTTDVYTITYNDATTSTFEVYNGEDGKDGLPGTIDHIAKTAGTGASGTTDTYTAYADAAETQILGTFNVYNGYDGVASTIGTLVDVDLTTIPVEDGQTIIWNEVEGKWLPGDVSSSAINMTYDNTTSALTATDVQGAIDEIENSIDEVENSAVKLTGDQTIEDVKTFTSSPIVPTPTTGTQAVNKDYVDNLKIIATGAATFNSTTNNINLTGIGIGVEIGDVIQISGATDGKNNSEFTVEVITDNNNIIVNQAHANKGTSKNIANRTGDTGVTVKLLAKYYNAPLGLGQDWVEVTSIRNSLNVEYVNLTNRIINVVAYRNVVSNDSYMIINFDNTGAIYTKSRGQSGSDGHATFSFAYNEKYKILEYTLTKTLELR